MSWTLLYAATSASLTISSAFNTVASTWSMYKVIPAKPSVVAVAGSPSCPATDLERSKPPTFLAWTEVAVAHKAQRRGATIFIVVLGGCAVGLEICMRRRLSSRRSLSLFYELDFSQSFPPLAPAKGSDQPFLLVSGHGSSKRSPDATKGAT